MYLKVGLEISLSKRREGVYRIALRYTEPESAAEIRMGPAQETDLQLDLSQLQTQILDPDSYADMLSNSFFAEEAVRTMFAKARSNAERLNIPLSVRLIVDDDATELQNVYWELLRDPTDRTALFLGENIFFSRYLSSTSWRKVQLRPRAKLRGLVVVANPEDLSDYQGMAAIPIDAEVERARHALGDIPLTVLGTPGERASLKNLIRHLQTEKPDILYLVCHGAIKVGLPYLWLEDEEGITAITSGKELAEQIQELASPPLLVVLTSCQSAGHPKESEFRTALGPRLAQAGIPAVVAMQGNISQATVAEFMPAFFESLQKNGEVDRAISLARGCVRTRHDFWMPVLFSRLSSGVIFAEPEAATRAVRFGWLNWTIFTTLILLGSVIMALLLVPATGRRLRAELPWVRCKWPLPMETTGEIKVAVAEFNLPTNLPAKNDVRNIHTQITPYIQRLASDLVSLLYCPIGNDDPSALASKIGADILVYGDISKEGASWYVQPKFYVHPDLSGADELTGDEVFGQKILLGTNLASQPSVTSVIDSQLGAPLEALRVFLDGIILYKTGYFYDAQIKFNQVIQIWPETDQGNGNTLGKEIVYLWLGNAYYPRSETEATSSNSETADCTDLGPGRWDETMFGDLAQPDEELLSDLPPGYRCAWDAFLAGLHGPDSTRRLLLSMGNWWAELPPQVLFNSPQPKCLEYEAAGEYYLEAAKPGTETGQKPLTGLKAEINLGLLDILAANDSCDVLENLYLQAKDHFSLAYDRVSQLDDSAEVRNLKAKAAYQLARTYRLLDDPQAAISAYGLALVVTGPKYTQGDPPWQVQIRWESYIQRGYQYIRLAEAGDANAWQSALNDFDAFTNAIEEGAPYENVYALDAYDGRAKVLDQLGDDDGSSKGCLEFQKIMVLEENTAGDYWCDR